jgi:hypothetical protein
MVAVVPNYEGEKWGSKNRAVKSITGAIGATSAQRAGGGKRNDGVRFL